MKFKQKGNAFLGLLVIVVALASILGYVLNIIKLHNHVGALTVTELERVIGIVVPFVGAVLGYIG